MLTYLKQKFFSSKNDKLIASLRPIVAKINALEADLTVLTDQQLQHKTIDFKARLARVTLDDVLVEAFAVVREAAKRVMKKRHFDVQLMGGIVLHRGMVAEMRTGEGKTLMSTLPVYLNALSGKGVHVVTVNDYLAKRDAAWMGDVYRFLGLTVGCIYQNLPDDQRQAAYQCDITYGTNNEFGFDYLRDNLKYNIEAMVQRKFNYAIVDEVDSILIDEARTPLIISGPTDDNSELYSTINGLISNLSAADYDIDEKNHSVSLTDHGYIVVEELLIARNVLPAGASLYDSENISVIHHVHQSLRAHYLFKKDDDYIVRDGKVMIIDEFTGRVMDGRRYSEGLHQALEAKEKVAIQNENQTLASITFQNYFRMYPKLAGMTGTALTEANELMDIYHLSVVEIPTNLPVQRVDCEDQVYKTAEEKHQAIIDEIKALHAKGQPILVGTTSIEKSEYLSQMLRRNKIKHEVLNAKYHEKEAEIIAQAGRLKAVTIATNMAGRGTDIMLGGNPEILSSRGVSDAHAICAAEQEEVRALGGLFILGTERHESRRIDNQLRGRAGRQGDPGISKFYLSLEDDLMRIFGSDKLGPLLTKLGLQPGEVITHPWVSRALGKAQQKVEARNYEMRKNLLKYDDVMNEQRSIIYDERHYFMGQHDLTKYIHEMIAEYNQGIVEHDILSQGISIADETAAALRHEFKSIYGIDFPSEIVDESSSKKEIAEKLDVLLQSHLQERRHQLGDRVMKQAERDIIIMTQDHLWKEHLYELDQLRNGINLRAYGQKNPLTEYKLEAFKMFKAMLTEFHITCLQRIFHLRVHESMANSLPKDMPQGLIESREDPSDLEEMRRGKIVQRFIVPAAERDPEDPSTWGRISRNELCPCGSGKKYKHCHGAV